jgi:hypothetical protein
VRWVLLKKIENGFLVTLVHQRHLLQIALALLVLLGKDVVVERMLALHLAGAGQLEPLLDLLFILGMASLLLVVYFWFSVWTFSGMRSVDHLVDLTSSSWG